MAAWAVRLGSYLVTRVVKTGGDARFDDVKDKPGKFFVYWTMQVRRRGRVWGGAGWGGWVVVKAKLTS